MGISKKLRIIFVVFVERIDQEIRIISARKANLKERHRYEKRLK